MRFVAALSVLLVIGLAGCAGDAVSFQVGGSFRQDRADSDLDDLRATAAPYSDDVLVMESFPEQFNVRGLDEHGCNELRALLQAKAYLQHVGACTSYTGRA